MGKYKPEKHTFARAVYRTLLYIYLQLQLQLLFQESGDAFQCSLPGLLASGVNVAVIGISRKVSASSLKFFVEVVEESEYSVLWYFLDYALVYRVSA